MAKKAPDDKSIGWDSIGKVEKLLTLRWNNWISFGVGIPVLIYAVVVLSSSGSVGLTGYLGMVVLGVIY
jgi:hypothetical protein